MTSHQIKMAKGVKRMFFFLNVILCISKYFVLKKNNFQRQFDSNFFFNEWKSDFFYVYNLQNFLYVFCVCVFII